jgi:hypothetical protein
MLAGSALAVQEFSDFTTPLPIPSGNSLVLGIVGGWESWDAPHRAVRRTALEIRSLRLLGIWVETIENHRLELAQKLVNRAFDFDRSGHLSPSERDTAQIIIYGQSLGARAALRLCRWLGEQDIDVRLVVLVDAVGPDPYTVPLNVAAAANLYQRDFGPVRGAPKIVAVNSRRTCVLGNWRYRYTGRDVEMPGSHFLHRWFMRSHLKMEYDLEPWSRVQNLIVTACSKVSPGQ